MSGTQQPASRALGVVTIVLTLLGWTSIPLFLYSFRHDIDGWTANGWRYAISAVLWLPVLVWAWRRRALPPGLWRAALITSAFNIPGQACFGLAPYFISPGLMTFSMRLQIVFLTVGAALMFPAERVLIRRPGFIVGIAMVMIFSMATVALDPEPLGSATGVGALLAVGAGLFYSGYALAVRKYTTGMNPLVAFAAVNQVTGAGLFALMLAFAPNFGNDVFRLDGRTMWMVALSAVIGIGLGHTFYFLSVGRLGLATSTAVVQLQPITVSVAQMFIFGESLTPGQWATGLAAVAGAGVVLHTQHRVAAAMAAAKRAE